MANFDEARLNMLDGQVRSNDVTDHELRSAIGELPRERFVPKALQGVAYADGDIEISEGRYLMDPRALSKLVQSGEVKSHHLVLLIGCGTGYTAAVLGKLAESVVAVESDEDLASRASTNLAELEIDNVAVVTGEMEKGLPDQGPYDVIIFDGSIAERSPEIEQQLNDGGKLAVILQDGPIGTAHTITRDQDRFVSVPLFDASVPRLPGFEREATFEF